MKDFQNWLDSRLALAEKHLAHYVPLIVGALVFLTLVLIPLKVVSLGYIPPDDASRHVAKAISGKPWSEILVMRPDITLDQHLGWHTLLQLTYKTFFLDNDSLVIFSVVSLCIIFSLTFFFGFRRSESVILAMLLCVVTHPGILYRQMLGRPYIFSMSVLILILLLWSNKNRIRWTRCAVTILALAAAVWIHGACWYLFLLPVAAFFLSGYIVQGLALFGCWAAGCLGGALLTGHPITFLREQLIHMSLAFSGQPLTRMLVTEFQPADGSFGLVLAIACLILAQKLLHGKWDPESFKNPIFYLGLLGWILGFKVVRFWLDWGYPAFLVWMTMQIQILLVWNLGYESLKRLSITAFGCLALFLASTGDTHGRWTDNLSVVFIDAGDKKIADWLPGKGGIIYAADMGIFYNTFYKNPHAPWKYILGFEPGLMPEEDLKVYRTVQWRYLDAAYDPWVKKMRPEDRLFIRGVSGVVPSIPSLEWSYVVHGTWVGRLPKEKKEAGGNKPKPEVKDSVSPTVPGKGQDGTGQPKVPSKEKPG